MNFSKQLKAATMYIGIVYLYSHMQNIPLTLIEASNVDMENDDWVEDLLTQTCPKKANSQWYGAHVVLTHDQSFDLRTYSPVKQAGVVRMLEYSREEIVEALH